jgi:hypothetical protein
LPKQPLRFSPLESIREISFLIVLNTKGDSLSDDFIWIGSLIMVTFFPPPLNRLVLEAWSAGVYCSEDNRTMEAVKDLPSRRGSIPETQAEVANLETGNPDLFNEEDAELHLKHTVSRTQE